MIASTEINHLSKEMDPLGLVNIGIGGGLAETVDYLSNNNTFNGFKFNDFNKLRIIHGLNSSKHFFFN